MMTTQPTSSAELSSLPARLSKGMTLGRYVVDSWVRDGGMASLYRGHHSKTGALVAIKLQMSGQDDAITAARFDREAEVIGRLSKAQNVVQVHDVDDIGDGRRYVVMEWIEGENLEEILDELRNSDQPMRLERACRLMKDIALGLHAAHQANVIHRDIKPSNIMIDRSHPDREIAKLVDFGISADLGTDGQIGELTATGIVLGTSGYVAPEQAVGLPADPGFDIYAMGVVLFEMLTGYRPPPEGLASGGLPDVRTLRSRVPARLAELTAACLRRNPQERPAGATAVIKELDATLQELASPTPDKRGSSVVTGLPSDLHTSGMQHVALPIATREVASGPNPNRIHDGPPAAALPPNVSGTGLPPQGAMNRVFSASQGTDSSASAVGSEDLSGQKRRRRGYSLASVILGGLIAVVLAALIGVWKCGVIPPIQSTPPHSKVERISRLTPSASSSKAQIKDSQGPPTDTNEPLDPTGKAEPTTSAVFTHRPTEAKVDDPSPQPDEKQMELSTQERDPRPSASSNSLDTHYEDTAGESTRPQRPKSGQNPTKPSSNSRRKIDECKQARKRALEASSTGNWQAVLEYSNRARCWPSKIERTRLRVDALFQLGRYKACTQEGAGATDLRVVQMTKFCRSRAGE